MSDNHKDAQGELPAERTPNSSDPRDEAHAAGWNACLAAVRASQVSAAAPADSAVLIALRDGIHLQEPVSIGKALRAQREARVSLSGGTGPVACVMLVNIQLTSWADGPEKAEAYAEGFNNALKLYRGALLQVAIDRASEGQAQTSAATWISVKDQVPKDFSGFLLVTNNIEARDAFGNMSHVWLAGSLHAQSDSSYLAFAHPTIGTRVENITHWKPATQLTNKAAEDLTACANCLRPKCEHNGKLCPIPFTTHWHAWDYADQPQPVYPEYAAQLADSTAPGAPKVEGQLMEARLNDIFLALAHAWSDADRKRAEERMRWFIADVKATLTAQQSLTAGGAVPDEPTDTELLDAVQAISSELNYMDYRWLQDAAQFGVRTAIKKALQAHKVMVRPEGFAAAPLPQVQPSEAARDVLAERRRQVEAEGWTPEHDDAHDGGCMAQAAACYAYPELVTVLPGLNAWPWAEEWWKPRDARRNYVRAAALLLAEIERIDRAADQQPVTPSGALGDSNGGVA